RPARAPRPARDRGLRAGRASIRPARAPPAPRARPRARAPALRAASPSRPGGRSAWDRTASGRRLHLVELAPQRLDLIAQLGRVLEAEVLRRQQHLLLELDDRLVDLTGGHSLLPLAPVATPPGARHL